MFASDDDFESGLAEYPDSSKCCSDFIWETRTFVTGNTKKIRLQTLCLLHSRS